MKLSSIDLNLLLVLSAVLEEQSVTRAASRLHVTAPAISNALSRLRAALNDPLFVRRGRGLVPTPRALELGPVLRQAFVAMEASLSDEVFDAATCTRTFTLALSDADQLATLPAIVKSFVAALPRARLTITSIDALVSGGGLASERVDCAIGPPFPGEGLHRTKLFEQEAVYVASSAHPRLKGRLSARQFNAERHIDIHLVLGRPGAGNHSVQRAIAAAGLHREIAMTVPSFGAAASIVSSTELITGMPRSVALQLAPAFHLQVLRGPGAPFVFEMFLHWHERTNRDPAASAFRQAIVDAVGVRPRR
ncbi:MAG: LysR family transcriptional regulator [Archangiaceae bacterium]|nr:LysR family transcriptional regulator [Archangiaceae bacterium]